MECYLEQHGSKDCWLDTAEANTSGDIAVTAGTHVSRNHSTDARSMPDPRQGFNLPCRKSSLAREGSVSIQ